VYRCGNEAGSRDYCTQHRLHPLYLVLRDQSLSPIDTRLRLAPLLGVAQVGSRGEGQGGVWQLCCCLLLGVEVMTLADVPSHLESCI
jgi:hypothetical protein